MAAWREVKHYRTRPPVLFGPRFWRTLYHIIKLRFGR